MATMAVNGAKNAALFAVEILALADDELAKKLTVYRHKLITEVALKEQKIQQSLHE